jgi:uncharacterized membrane protein YozB (DUF420 family)
MSLPELLPAINASLNGIATVLLAAGFVLIKSGRKEAHRKCMMSAFGVSAVFLVGYVANRVIAQTAHTPFAGEGMWKTIYYVMLFSHILLAMVILPLIFITFNHALKGRFEKHKAWARWTFPAWFYVSVTGVLVYFFLYQWFPSK